MLRILRATAIAVGTLFVGGHAAAAYPDRPITLVVPYNAGGPTDAMARFLQGPLQKELGVTIVVENVAGAGGAIGAQRVLRAPADGYTLFLGNNGPSAVTPLLQDPAPFDPLQDFTPVSLISRATMILALSGQTPASTLAEFVAYAKTRPGQLNYASAGIGSLGHLASTLMIQQAGLDMVHIPYKGQAPTLTALMAGEVDFLLTTPTDAMRAQDKDGRIRIVGVTSAQESPFDPGVAPIAETVDDFVLYSWFALLVRDGTPADIVETLHRAVTRALDDPAVQERFASLGVVAESSDADTVAQLIRQDVDRWSQVIREHGITAN